MGYIDSPPEMYQCVKLLILSTLMGEGEQNLAAVLGFFVGRPLKSSEIYTALGMSKSAYFKASRDGRLVNSDNLLKAAAHFGLNPLDLLTQCGLIDLQEISDFVERDPHFFEAGARSQMMKLSFRPRTSRVRLDIPPV